ncbi:hypothetical protein BN79_013 [Yersinia phage phiR2-01]|uniref:Uncharacterized protein n=1 Tax=Yersinia phage phiR2-01 TaxID=1206557 RepID=I7K2K2_9CAUD|nr:hypothetical protein BN79_013 [Yersinia phage phiR2-01]CCI88441.1 hypothetical protein BN79_013 [Yersinia phage phiR2-01]
MQNKENELHQQRLHNTIVKQFVQGHKQYTDADFIKYLKSYLRIK